MNANELTRAQARAIRAQIEPMRDYLYRLRKRMATRGFPLDDPLFVLVVEAQQAIGQLFMDVAARGYSGPIEAPRTRPLNPLDQRSARKRHDRR